jgi:Acyltransferase
LFRLRVAGLDRLPTAGPFVIAPNHVSYLDSLVVAAALRWSVLRRAYWAGDALRLFPHPVTRVFCRAAHLFPVDAMHPGAALETANRVLTSGNVLVCFPEGWRSPDGRLQQFLQGIGQLLLRRGVPAVPTHIGRAFAALPLSKAASAGRHLRPPGTARGPACRRPRPDRCRGGRRGSAPAALRPRRSWRDRAILTAIGCGARKLRWINVPPEMFRHRFRRAKSARFRHREWRHSDGRRPG